MKNSNKILLVILLGLQVIGVTLNSMRLPTSNTESEDGAEDVVLAELFRPAGMQQRLDLSVIPKYQSFSRLGGEQLSNSGLKILLPRSSPSSRSSSRSSSRVGTVSGLLRELALADPVSSAMLTDREARFAITAAKKEAAREAYAQKVITTTAIVMDGLENMLIDGNLDINRLVKEDGHTLNSCALLCTCLDVRSCPHKPENCKNKLCCECITFLRDQASINSHFMVGCPERMDYLYKCWKPKLPYISEATWRCLKQEILTLSQPKRLTPRSAILWQRPPFESIKGRPFYNFCAKAGWSIMENLLQRFIDGNEAIRIGLITDDELIEQCCKMLYAEALINPYALRDFDKDITWKMLPFKRCCTYLNLEMWTKFIEQYKPINDLVNEAVKAREGIIAAISYALSSSETISNILIDIKLYLMKKAAANPQFVRCIGEEVQEMRLEHEITSAKFSSDFWDNLQEIANQVGGVEVLSGRSSDQSSDSSLLLPSPVSLAAGSENPAAASTDNGMTVIIKPAPRK